MNNLLINIFRGWDASVNEKQPCTEYDKEDEAYKAFITKWHRWPKHLLCHIFVGLFCFCFSLSHMKNLWIIEIPRTELSLSARQGILLLLFYLSCIHLHSAIQILLEQMTLPCSTGGYRFNIWCSWVLCRWTHSRSNSFLDYTPLRLIKWPH